MVTTKASAYYALVSRLKKADLPFTSLTPDSDWSACDVVLTTSRESVVFGNRALALEALDESPDIFKGQVLTRLGDGDDVVLIGIDPGKRIGLAVFYGHTRLAFGTFHSIGAVCSKVAKFSDGMPQSRFEVRIGNGDVSMAARLSEMLGQTLPLARIEVVDETGTSTRSAKIRGVQSDELAAARIAFRRGKSVSLGKTRTVG